MKSWRARAALLAGAAALLVAIPASSQNRDDPESLLPPGFEDPQEPEPDTPTPTPTPPTPVPAPITQSPAAQDIVETGDDEEEEDEDPLDRPRPLNYFTVPTALERPTDRIGVIGPGNFGFAPDAFGTSRGTFLITLMERLDAPVASRWASILLRRALMSRLVAPGGAEPVDWAAARADLLLRMGEADAARMLVQRVDNSQATPRFIEAAARTALATGDPGAMCPLVGPASSRETVWKLAEAMCAGLEGESARASALVDEARRRGDIPNVDYLLTEKVIGAMSETRRSATIEWDEVDQLTAWRAGLASATGAELPQPLIAAADPAIQAWLARGPMLTLEQRQGAALVAAAMGVISASGLVEMFSLTLDQTDPAEAGGSVGARLRDAWAAREAGSRLEAMRSLWGEAEGGPQRYAWLILTSGAAARISPSADHEADLENLLASMLAGGHDREASRWAETVGESGNEDAWALLAVGAPAGAVDAGQGRIEQYIGSDTGSPEKKRALVAALGGLGRIEAGDWASLAASVGLDSGNDRWSEAISSAARARAPGTVALLAAAAMQTRDWNAVPPRHLFHLIRALRGVGLEYEARMIAAEAITRL